MKVLRAWACLCLLSLTAGCADQPVVTKTEYRQVYLPDRFLRSCPVPQWPGGSFEEVGKHAVRLKHALENCNLQLESGRQYQAGVRSGAVPLSDKN